MSNLRVTKSDYHRNGVSGEGFHVVLFDWVKEGDEQKGMCAFVFSQLGRIAVTKVGELAYGNIEFGNGNSWRGDHFEEDIRKYLSEKEN
jgi:hypothetical protein